MALLTAYLDNSETYLGGREVTTVSVGGVVARPDDWAVFSEEWTSRVHSLGLTRWHATDAKALEGEFVGWTGDEVVAAYSELQEILVRVPRLLWFVMIADRRDFLQLSPTAQARFGSAYSLACHMVFAALAYSLHHQGFERDAQVAYVVDHPGSNSGVGQMRRLYEEMQKIPSIRETARLAKLEFSDSIQSPPIQAADIVAHDLRLAFDALGSRMTNENFTMPKLAHMNRIVQRADRSFMERVSERHEGALYYL